MKAIQLCFISNVYNVLQIQQKLHVSVSVSRRIIHFITEICCQLT
jgi:hypothetical protein